MTVRESIVRAVVSAVEDLEWVGGVAATPDIAEEAFAATLGDGAAFVELLVGDDVVESEGVQGPVQKTFTVGLIAHLPNPLPEGRDHLGLAGDYYADLVRLYTSSPQARTWGGLAMTTADRGGGGISLDGETGTVVTAHAFSITYRHAYGAPEVG